MFHRRADRLKMVLGENARITGDVESTGAVFIDGAIRGNVEGAKVILGEHGCVDGDIKAGTIIIGTVPELWARRQAEAGWSPEV